jgi:SAM-dependent methyltransferase
VGVDPAPRRPVDHAESSDAYFAAHPDERFDLVFVDGLHLHEQVLRDVANALRALRSGGFVVLHDCNPPSEFHQRERHQVGARRPPWTGTVWKAWVELRATRADLAMHVVDTDFGVGVIRPGGGQELLRGARLDYAWLAAQRRSALNLISVPEFIALYRGGSLR